MSDEPERKRPAEVITLSDVPEIPKVGRISVARKKIARVDWRNRDFKDLNALGAEFEDCDFRFSNFERAYFRDAKFSNCRFDGARFVDCNLKSVHFYRCDLKFVHFQRCLLDVRELLASLPPEPNIRREGLQSLRSNAVETGDQASVGLLILQEIEATKLHFSYAMRGYDTYYRMKYPTVTLRLKAAAQLWWLQLQGLIWGHGERPWRLLASCLVILGGLALANFWCVMPRVGWNQTDGGLDVVAYVIRLFLDLPVDATFRGFAAIDYIDVMMRYVYVGLFISVLYKSISRR